ARSHLQSKGERISGERRLVEVGLGRVTGPLGVRGPPGFEPAVALALALGAGSGSSAAVAVADCAGLGAAAAVAGAICGAAVAGTELEASPGGCLSAPTVAVIAAPTASITTAPATSGHLRPCGFTGIACEAARAWDVDSAWGTCEGAG